MKTELFLKIKDDFSVSPGDGFVRIGARADRSELLDMLNQVATALTCLDPDPEFRRVRDLAQDRAWNPDMEF